MNPPLFDGKKDPDRRQQAETGLPVELVAWIQSEVGDPRYPVRLRFGKYRKTAPAYAVRMPERFEVDTLEGRHGGKAGDYLAIGAHGEMYPIDADVFEATYELVE